MEQGKSHGDDHANESPEPEQFRKLFIGGLTYGTNDDMIKEFYSQWGNVVDCVVMIDSTTKKSRGFGFVTYAKSSQLDESMKNRPHTIDGKVVEPKRAIPRDSARAGESNVSVKKLYVSGVREEHNEDMFRQYFSDYGSVVDVDVIVDKNTGKKRGFAFVTFDDYDSVDKCVLQRSHIIDGKRCDVKKALSREEMQRAQQKDREREMRDGRSRGGGSFGGGRGGARNWGAAGGGGGGWGGNYGGAAAGGWQGGGWQAPTGGWGDGYGGSYGASGGYGMGGGSWGPGGAWNPAPAGGAQAGWGGGQQSTAWGAAAQGWSQAPLLNAPPKPLGALTFASEAPMRRTFPKKTRPAKHDKAGGGGGWGGQQAYGRRY